MTTERRLAKVEAALGPKELVLRWLAEAHAHDNFTAYARAMFAIGPDSLPLDRLVHETIDLVDATDRGVPRDDRQDRRQKALRQVIFLFYLVMRTIERTEARWHRDARGAGRAPGGARRSGPVAAGRPRRFRCEGR